MPASRIGHRALTGCRRLLLLCLSSQHDMTDWEKLTSDEKHFVKHVLAFFAASYAPRPAAPHAPRLMRE